MVHQLSQKMGNYASLLERKDVVYTYTYRRPDGQTSISTERYIFNGELSLGEYEQHQTVHPDLEGPIVQAYDGETFWLKDGTTFRAEEALLQRAQFVRNTNFYWFAMFQKLLDPGLTYEYVGEHRTDEAKYEVVKVGFEAADDQATDIYQLYINQETQLVDQFLFTVVDYGVMEEPFLMKVAYEEVDGLMIPSQRKYRKSNWEAEETDAPWITANWTDIRFDNGLKRADFQRTAYE